MLCLLVVRRSAPQGRNAEQLAGQTISGTTNAEVGQTVTVTFNGQTWTATVGSGGSWSVFIPAQQFAGLSDGSYTISATVSDQAGNPGSASRGVTLNGDVPTVTINTFAGDDVVNAAEHGSSLVISGTTTIRTLILLFSLISVSFLQKNS